MRIFLIGFMGSGKSTVGRKLAHGLYLDLIDLDKFIEKKYKKTIPEIFGLYGEPWFREKERNELVELLRRDNYIMSTGGGTPCFYNNMQLINNNGISIYLRATPLELADRLRKSKYDRPLIKDIKNENLLQYIETKLIEREPFYLQSKIIVDCKINIRNLVQLINSMKVRQ
ncbi:MAG: AAA family ATPase [Bacteroidia bacterium]|nr:AAA family ATPase [Bacteroidia bacterium]